MPDSTHGLPPKSNGPLIAVGVVMLLLAGGLVFYKLQDQKGPEVIEERTTQVPEKKSEPVPFDNAPPPPPSEDDLKEDEKKDEPETKGTKIASGPVGCSGPCKGNATEEIKSALAIRGRGARGCYNNALRRNEHLQGKMTVNVRISSTGNVCSVAIANDSLGDPAVSSCVSAQFRSAKFPLPDGGCVDTAVPLNFTSQP